MSARGQRGPGRARARGYVLVGVVLTVLMAAAIAYQIGRESAQNVTMAASEAQLRQSRYVAEAGLAYAAARLNASGSCSGIAAGTPITGQIGSDSFSVISTPVATNPLTLQFTSTPTLAATGTAFAPLSKQVILSTRVEQQKTVYRAVSGIVADTFIPKAVGGLSNGNTYNFGADPVLVLDNGGKVTNILIRFDLVDALPAGAKLKTAQLVLTPVTPWGNTNDKTDVTAHEVTRTWPEGTGTLAAPTSVTSGATWDQTLPSVAWGFVRYMAPGSSVSGGVVSGGGDYDPAYVDTEYINAGAIPATYTWDITPLAAQWLANPAGNFGLLLKSEESLQQAKFASSEAASRSQRPQLVLTYLMPCGGPAVTLSTLDAATARPVLVATVNTPVKLRIDLANSAAAAATLTSPLSVSLPPNTSVASPAGAIVLNCGAMVFAPLAGDTTLTLLSGSIPAASGTAPGVCTVAVSISGTQPSGSATLASGPSGTATTLSVAAGQLVTSQGSNPAAASTVLYVVPLPTLDADTSIDSSNQNSNYGSQTSLGLRNNTSMRTLVRFLGLPPAGVPVQTATLRLYLRSIANPGLTTSIAIKPNVLNSTWVEGTATWASPSYNLSGLTLNSLTIPSTSVATWMAFDVAQAVNAWGGGAANNGLLLISTTPALAGQDELSIDSKERAGGNPAQLQMTY